VRPGETAPAGEAEPGEPARRAAASSS
jgi:hypothetical protein